MLFFFYIYILLFSFDAIIRGLSLTGCARQTSLECLFLVNECVEQTTRNPLRCVRFVSNPSASGAASNNSIDIDHFEVIHNLAIDPSPGPHSAFGHAIFCTHKRRSSAIHSTLEPPTRQGNEISVNKCQGFIIVAPIVNPGRYRSKISNRRIRFERVRF